MSPLTNNWLIAVIVLNCALMAPLAGLQDQPGSPNRPLGTGVAAIVVDAVVRDGKSHPVTNLRKEDFELFEDGVRQEIGDVTVVCTPARREAGDGTVGRPVWTGQSRTGATGGGATTPSFLAIVFDRLTPEARALAYQGASAYLETIRPRGDATPRCQVDSQRRRCPPECSGGIDPCHGSITIKRWTRSH
jgi:hypothetical protein